jgi:serine/threonine-protein kinase
MEPERWRRIEELFFAALESDAAGRAALMAAARSADPAVAREAEAMLAAHELGHGGGDGEGIEGFLLAARPLAAPSAPASPSAGPRAGLRLGAYRLIERIGQGGMGEVYLAERADGEFEQRVAVKLLRAGFEGPEGIARFRAERGILARLEHAHIARLLDGGVTPEGLPFLVMEHVRGEPITRYCDARNLTVEARLRLFVDVCRAVHFAHRSLVVHRDLKPSNILVTDEGEVKLLDFGIAKLIAGNEGGEGGEAEAATRTGLLLLTPEYASPEQIRGETITTATDVYALGLLLYELLTGRRAQAIADSSPLGIARAVCDAEPSRPSAAVLEGPLEEAEERDARAARLGLATAERLARRLRGDLDTLVAAAVHKDPSRRCASAERLADDLEKHLAGLPIEARADSFGYRAGKLLRRHRLAAAASAVAVVALVLGLLFALLGWVHARRSEAAARRDAETSRQVSELLVGIFEVNDPGETRGQTVTARELLDRGAERVRTQLAGQPEVQGNLLRTMGRAYSKLGLFRRAEAQYESDLALRQALPDADDRQVAVSLTLLGGEASRRGDYQRSKALALRALALLQKRGPAEDADTATALGVAGMARSNLGELAEARRTLERAVTIEERVLGPQHPDLGTLLNDLAIVHWRRNDLEAARPLYERALAIFERRFGTKHPTVANTLNNLALLHANAGRLEQARGLHERALAVRRAILAPDHPDVTESLNNLANVLLALGDPAAARPILEEALALRERVLGGDHPFVAATLCNLGIARARLGDPRAARPLLERSLAILARSLGPDHTDLAFPLEILAQIYRNTGDLAAADRASARVLALRDGTAGGSAPAYLKNALQVRAIVLRDLGRGREAEALEKRASAL